MTALRWWERWFEAMGWHRPGLEARYNLASMDGWERVCVRCGRRLLMDSQGNWFAV